MISFRYLCGSMLIMLLTATTAWAQEQGTPLAANSSDSPQASQSTPTSSDSADVEANLEQLPIGAWQWPKQPYHTPSQLPVYGQSMYYNPGVMARVIRYRLRVGRVTPCPECIGCVAMLRAGDLNRRVWLKLTDGAVEGPFWVTDVAARHDIPRLMALGWAVDVDWETAQRWQFQMPKVTILEAPPADWLQTVFPASTAQEMPCLHPQ
jgi:hypothetical protein